MFYSEERTPYDEPLTATLESTAERGHNWDLSQFFREDCSDRFSMTRLLCLFFALNAIYLSWALTGNERLIAIGTFVGGAAYAKVAQKKIERNILKDHLQSELEADRDGENTDTRLN